MNFSIKSFPDYEVENPGLPSQTVRITLTIAGRAIATRVATSSTSTYYYLFTDHLGSTILMASQNSAKNQLEAVTGSRATYYPFGDYRGLPPTQTLTDRGFTGQKSNNQPGADLGLLYYNARYYAPGIARFISADTIVPDPANPQAFNRYAYTLNNSVRFTDPSGHRTCTAQQAATGDETCNQNINDNDPGYLGNGYQSVRETATQVNQATHSLIEQTDTSDPAYIDLLEVARFTHERTIQYCEENGIRYDCSKRDQYIPCQYWQPCWEQNHLTTHTESNLLWWANESNIGTGAIAESPPFMVCIVICLGGGDKIYTNADGSSSLEQQINFGVGLGADFWDFGIGGYFTIRHVWVSNNGVSFSGNGAAWGFNLPFNLFSYEAATTVNLAQ